MKTLIKLYMQQSYEPAGVEGIRDIVRDCLEPIGYESDVDAVGNMFLTHKNRATNTLLCAHMDMVKTGNPIAIVGNMNGILFGLDKDYLNTSLGADDKNGVWLCIQAALTSGRYPSILLVAHEEGAPHTVDDWIANNQDVLAQYDNCLVLDRANDKEIIIGGSSKEYSPVLGAQFKTVNPDWEFAKGIMCDADRLIDCIPSINLSIGYYGGHRRTEYTDVDELNGALVAVNKWLTATDRKRNTINWKVIKELETFEHEQKGYNYGVYK